LATGRASVAESPAGVDSFPVLHPAKSRAAEIRAIPHYRLKMARFIAPHFVRQDHRAVGVSKLPMMKPKFYQQSDGKS
jgi:hypothetical protein